MVPRWSRLALAAVLACGAFGIGSGAALATTCGPSARCVEPTLAHGSSTAIALAVRDVADPGDAGAPAPLHGLLVATTEAPTAPGPAVAGPLAALASVDATHEPAWRLAPKTSPPRR